MHAVLSLWLVAAAAEPARAAAALEPGAAPDATLPGRRLSTRHQCFAGTANGRLKRKRPTDLLARAPFVVVASQRTGSTWISTTLNKSYCDVELFAGLLIDRQWNTAKDGERSDCRNLTLQREALAALYDDSAKVPARLATHHPQFAHAVRRSRVYRSSPVAYGFKWMTNQGMTELWPWFLELAAARGIRVVFLRRRDFMRMLVSKEHTDLRHVTTKQAAKLGDLRDRKVTLPTGSHLLRALRDLGTVFRSMDGYAEAARAAGVPVYNLVYEDLVNGEASFDDLWRFVTAPFWSTGHSTCLQPRRNASNQIQIHPLPPSHYVENWADVAATLRSSERWSQYLTHGYEVRSWLTPKPSPRPTPKPTFSQKDAAAATVQAEIQKELRAALGRFAELEAAHPEFKPEKRKVPGKVPDRFFLNHQGRRPAGKPKKSSSGKTRA